MQSALLLGNVMYATSLFLSQKESGLIMGLLQGCNLYLKYIDHAVFEQS